MHSSPTDLSIACAAAQKAAPILRSYFGNLREIHEKSDAKGDSKGLVTEADTASEQAILHHLRAHSTHPILSEESGFSHHLPALSRSLSTNAPPTGHSTETPSKRLPDGLDTTTPYWIVDPLDGTTNFARGLPWFAISIALLRGSEVLLGVVLDPLRDEIFCALRGGGAFCNEKPLQRSDIRTKQPAVFLNHGYAPEDRARFAEAARRLVPEASLRMLGPSALEICYAARGEVDAFVCSGDEIWDFAAGMLIATEAGCLASDWAGRPWASIHPSFVLIAAPWLHPTLIPQLADLQPAP
ncbi:hypothetical protein L6R29_21125 [Myxococcota bacterium]|nr:hypothetical protein [Myxococcota bacterium]